MRAKVKKDPSDQMLVRILDAFAQELMEASDAEILEAAQELGMDPQSRMSAAFAGVTYPSRPQLSDFFDIELAAGPRIVASPIAEAPRPESKSGSRRARRPRSPGGRKIPDEE